MKKVLLISHGYSASGYLEADRIAKIVDYLPEFGWEPVVLTVEGDDTRDARETTSILSERITKVYRSRIFDPLHERRRLWAERPPELGATPKFRTFVRNTVFIPDAYIGWYPYAVPTALEICSNEGIDAIFSSSPPYTSAIIGREVHDRTKLPWMAELRDVWTESIASRRRWGFSKRVDRYLERSVYENANLLVGTRRSIVKNYQEKYPHISPLKCLYLPNGFDRREYADSEKVRHDEFTITHIGRGFGNPSTFLKALASLVAEQKIDPEKVRVKLIGWFSDEVKATIESSGFKRRIDILSDISREGITRQLVASDLTIFISENDNENPDLIDVNFSYCMGAHRPILALVENGEFADILTETRSGKAISGQDVSGIEDALVESYKNFVYHNENFDPDEGKVSQYECREITRRLAGLLDYLQNRR